MYKWNKDWNILFSHKRKNIVLWLKTIKLCASYYNRFQPGEDTVCRQAETLTKLRQ